MGVGADVDKRGFSRPCFVILLSGVDGFGVSRGGAQSLRDPTGGVGCGPGRAAFQTVPAWQALPDPHRPRIPHVAPQF